MRTISMRASWRQAVREVLAGADPFVFHEWTAPADIARVVDRIADANLTYALAPGGGGFEFNSAVAVVGQIVHLATSGSRHIIAVARLDYVPHPTNFADAVFRLELKPMAFDDGLGPMSTNGHSQGFPRPDEDTADPWPDHRWLKGVFVFTGKEGLANNGELDDMATKAIDAKALHAMLEGMSRAIDPECHGIADRHLSALQRLCASTMADRMPLGWLEMWGGALSGHLTPSTLDTVVNHVLATDGELPPLAVFRELCETVEDGLPVTTPRLSIAEQNAQLLVTDLSARYPELDDGDMSDALLIAAAALYMRTVLNIGLDPARLAKGEFTPRAGMFGEFAAEWATPGRPGSAGWDAFFGRNVTG